MLNKSKQAFREKDFQVINSIFEIELKTASISTCLYKVNIYLSWKKTLWQSQIKFINFYMQFVVINSEITWQEIGKTIWLQIYGDKKTIKIDP